MESRYGLQEPSFDGEQDTETTEEIRMQQFRDSYLEDAPGFVNELWGKETEEDIIKYLDQYYDTADLARGLISLFKESIKK